MNVFKKAGKPTLLLLPALALLVTGCPHNDYVVELVPHGEAVERKLVFYRAEGVNTNGEPDYRAFPADELATIARSYPVNGVEHEGAKYAATGVFSGSLPNDIGGVGTYRKLTTTLGSAGFYMERFRGNDDLATQMAARLKAADKLVDLLIGWSRVELGREPGYNNLKRFLDGDFRRDFKNFGLYFWMQQVSSATKAKAPEEFWVRFGQYLVEHGYVRLEDLPGLIRDMADDEGQRGMGVIQRMVADKLGVPAASPIPKSLTFLGDPSLTEKSWENYLATTEIYRAKLRRWERRKFSIETQNLGRRGLGLFNFQGRTNGVWAKVPVPAKPTVSEVTDSLGKEFLELELFNTDDTLTVRLSLPAAPAYSNGQWDDAARKVVWKNDLERGTNASRLPAFCYATWSESDDAAQTRCFGAVALNGEALIQYCVWHAGLDNSQSAEWDAFMADLKPGAEFQEKLARFQFANETNRVSINGQPQVEAMSSFPKKLIASALEKNANPGKQEKTGTKP